MVGDIKVVEKVNNSQLDNFMTQFYNYQLYECEICVTLLVKYITFSLCIFPCVRMYVRACVRTSKCEYIKFVC